MHRSGTVHAKCTTKHSARARELHRSQTLTALRRVQDLLQDMHIWWPDGADQLWKPPPEMRTLAICRGAVSPEHYRSCLGSRPDTRGYTCGLWMLLHSLAAGCAAQPTPYRSALERKPLIAFRTTGDGNPDLVVLCIVCKAVCSWHHLHCNVRSSGAGGGLPTVPPHVLSHSCSDLIDQVAPARSRVATLSPVSLCNNSVTTFRSNALPVEQMQEA